MKNPKVGDEDYQAVTESLNQKDPAQSPELKESYDVSTKREANSRGTSRLGKDREVTRLDGAPKKLYSKPTLINYGTARELAKRLGSSFKWPDLFT
jgi:hypothetical protein